MPDKAWKKRERDVAGYFKGMRTPLSGGNGNRVDKAVSLYNQEYSQNILITGPNFLHTSYPKLMASYATKQGVPPTAITLETESHSTKDHPKYIQKLLSKNIQSLIIVTSKFHTKRSYNCFKHIFEDSQVDVMVVAADDGINYKQWWKDHESCEKILMELCKTIWYKLFVGI